MQSVTSKSGNITATFDIDSGVFNGIASDVYEVVREGAIATGNRWGDDEVTPWMKDNAPWQDQTTNARQSLGVLSEVDGETIKWIFTSGVFYMLYLEMKQAGKYAILGPAMDTWAQTLIDRLGAERD